MRILINNNKFLILILLAVLFLLLTLVYKFFVVENYSYMGFLGCFSFSRLLLSFSILLFTLCLISSIKVHEFIYFIVILYLAFAIIPSSITYTNQLIGFSILISHYFILYSILKGVHSSITVQA